METHGNNYVLWRDDECIVKTPFNPHTSYEEGANVIVQPVHEIPSASRDPELAGRVFTLAAKVGTGYAARASPTSRPIAVFAILRFTTNATFSVSL